MLTYKYLKRPVLYCENDITNFRSILESVLESFDSIGTVHYYVKFAETRQYEYLVNKVNPYNDGKYFSRRLNNECAM